MGDNCLKYNWCGIKCILKNGLKVIFPWTSGVHIQTKHLTGAGYWKLGEHLCYMWQRLKLAIHNRLHTPECRVFFSLKKWPYTYVKLKVNIYQHKLTLQNPPKWNPLAVKQMKSQPPTAWSWIFENGMENNTHRTNATKRILNMAPLVGKREATSNYKCFRETLMLTKKQDLIEEWSGWGATILTTWWSIPNIDVKFSTRRFTISEIVHMPTAKKFYEKIKKFDINKDVKEHLLWYWININSKHCKQCRRKKTIEKWVIYAGFQFFFTFY